MHSQRANIASCLLMDRLAGWLVGWLAWLEQGLLTCIPSGVLGKAGFSVMEFDGTMLYLNEANSISSSANLASPFACWLVFLFAFVDRPEHAEKQETGGLVYCLGQRKKKVRKKKAIGR